MAIDSDNESAYSDTSEKSNNFKGVKISSNTSSGPESNNQLVIIDHELITQPTEKETSTIEAEILTHTPTITSKA